MYIVVSDYTNEKADVYKSVSIDKAYTFALRANASDGLRAHIPPVAPPRKG